MNKTSNGYDPQKLADAMVKVFKTMDVARKEVIEFNTNRVGIEQNQSSAVIKALRTLASMIATRNYYRQGTEKFNKGIAVWEANHKRTPLSGTAKKELIDIVSQHGIKWRDWSSPNRITILLEQLQNKTVKEWTEGLYHKVISGSKKVEGEVIGISKGADNYLRDFGYFSRVPIDIHEKRFILRTGIFHLYSSRKSNPLAYKDFQESLVNFCRTHLSGSVVETIDLGQSPGIVDIFIWNFCAKKRFNICGATPLCNECPLSTVCLFSIFNNNQ